MNNKNTSEFDILNLQYIFKMSFQSTAVIKLKN